MGIPANLSVAVGKELTKEAMETLRGEIDEIKVELAGPIMSEIVNVANDFTVEQVAECSDECRRIGLRNLETRAQIIARWKKHWTGTRIAKCFWI